MKYFWGYEDFVDIFMGSSQNLASLRVICMHFMFFKVNIQNRDIFWVAKISFWWGGGGGRVLEIPDIFLG